MIEATMNRRPIDMLQIQRIMKRLEKMSDEDREILDMATFVFYTLFDMDPSKYQFDFRFNLK